MSDAATGEASCLMRSSWESDDEAERAATASACPPAPPHARAPLVDGRASVVCAPFKFIFLHSLCCGGDTREAVTPPPMLVCAAVATLERRTSQELASKAAHAHPTPIPIRLQRPGTSWYELPPPQTTEGREEKLDYETVCFVPVTLARRARF